MATSDADDNLHQITVARRFNGPPASANGGYVSGLAAALIDGPAEITLRAPPPLETPLRVARGQAGAAMLFAGETLVLEARPRTPLPPPALTPPSLQAARAAAAHFDAAAHGLPTCFVCGPARAPGDGLRIFAAGEPGAPMVADVWTPGADLADASGRVRPAFLWAALDCPGYFALDARNALLGRFAADILARPAPGAPLIIVGWPMGAEGRKHHAGTALFTAEGDLLAHAHALWIELAPKEAAP